VDFPGVRAFSSVPGHRNPAYMKLSTNFRWNTTNATSNGNVTRTVAAISRVYAGSPGSPALLDCHLHYDMMTCVARERNGRRGRGGREGCVRVCSAPQVR